MTIKTDLKSILSRRHVEAADVDDVGKLRVGVIAEKRQYGYDPIWVNHDLQLIAIGHLNLLYVLRYALADVCTIVDQVLFDNCIHGSNCRCGNTHDTPLCLIIKLKFISHHLISYIYII